ncbi:MAG: helix-turn-helix transcriptional regulator [Actinomycetota bacterium]|nr:helix-turn-helix transcriptional regulator [Actinomycetota bacterium]
MEWEEFKKDLLKDPEFKKEYEKLEPEYRIIRQILSLRRKKNLTQEQLAKLTGAKQSSIARMESGRHNTSLRLLEKIAEALDTELDIRFIPKAG